jgi:hypothetical protein
MHWTLAPVSSSLDSMKLRKRLGGTPEVRQIVAQAARRACQGHGPGTPREGENELQQFPEAIPAFSLPIIGISIPISGRL